MSSSYIESYPVLTKTVVLSHPYLKQWSIFEAISRNVGCRYNHHQPQIVNSKCQVRLPVRRQVRVKGHAFHPVRTVNGPQINLDVKVGTYLVFHCPDEIEPWQSCWLVLNGVQDVSRYKASSSKCFLHLIDTTTSSTHLPYEDNNGRINNCRSSINRAPSSPAEETSGFMKDIVQGKEGEAENNNFSNKGNINLYRQNPVKLPSEKLKNIRIKSISHPSASLELSKEDDPRSLLIQNKTDNLNIKKKGNEILEKTSNELKNISNECQKLEIMKDSSKILNGQCIAEEEEVDDDRFIEKDQNLHGNTKITMETEPSHDDAMNSLNSEQIQEDADDIFDSSKYLASMTIDFENLEECTMFDENNLSDDGESDGSEDSDIQKVTRKQRHFVDIRLMFSKWMNSSSPSSSSTPMMQETQQKCQRDSDLFVLLLAPGAEQSNAKNRGEREAPRLHQAWQFLSAWLMISDCKKIKNSTSISSSLSAPSSTLSRSKKKLLPEMKPIISTEKVLVQKD